VEQNGSEELIPTFYDYGRTFGPGLTGWSQFVYISLAVRGLSPQGQYTLLLNLYDPEERGTRLRVEASPTDHKAQVSRGLTVSLCPPRLVAQGISRRHAPEALLALPIPRELQDAPAIVVSIRGDSENVIYDRYTERTGSLFLSHAWLLKSR
jgi:hypothetical protein